MPEVSAFDLDLQIISSFPQFYSPCKCVNLDKIRTKTIIHIFCLDNQGFAGGSKDDMVDQIKVRFALFNEVHSNRSNDKYCSYLSVT